MEFEGREHSGIEDARNTAKLVWRMVNAGCQLHVTAAKDENSSTLANTAHRFRTAVLKFSCAMICIISEDILPAKMMRVGP